MVGDGGLAGTGKRPGGWMTPERIGVESSGVESTRKPEAGRNIGRTGTYYLGYTKISNGS